jgi:type IV pilus assembly protein PilM
MSEAAGTSPWPAPFQNSMAKRTKNLVGIDIDASSVTVAQASHSGSQNGDRVVKIDRVAHVPLESGIVRDGEVIDTEALATALRTLFKDNRGFGKRVRIGVANQKIVVRVLELPYLESRKELEAAVRFQAQDQIPMPLDQAVIDFQPLEVVDGPDGRRQRLVLVAARKDMVARVLDAVDRAGLRPEGLDVSAFAMIRALHRPGPADEHVLYVAVGGMTNLAVARGTSCLFTRASGGGIDAVAIELAERRTLTLDHARGWLEHVGLEEAIEDIEGDADIVAEARRVLLDGVRRIAAEIRNSLDYYDAQGGDTAVSRVVMTGPVTAVPGFAAALGSALMLPMTTGVVEGAPAGLDAGRVAVAAGLCLEEAPA